MSKNASVCIVLDQSALERLIDRNPDMELAIKEAAMINIVRAKVKMVSIPELDKLRDDKATVTGMIKEAISERFYDAPEKWWQNCIKLPDDVKELIIKTVNQQIVSTINSVREECKKMLQEESVKLREQNAKFLEISAEWLQDALQHDLEEVRKKYAEKLSSFNEQELIEDMMQKLMTKILR